MRRFLLSVVLLLLAASTSSGQWIEDSIDVGGEWVGDLAYNSRENVVYGVSGPGGGFFTVCCDSSRVIAQIPFYLPGHVAYDSIDNKAYCTFSYSPESLLVVDGHSHTRITTLPLPLESEGGECVWSSTLNRLYVASYDRDLLVLDCTVDTVLASIRIGRGSMRPVVNERHLKLYVPNDESETVSIVDLVTNEVTRTIQLGGVPEPGCYSYAADKFYLGCSEEVLVIDGVGDTLLGRVGSLPATSVSGMIAVDRSGLVVFGDKDSAVLYAVDVGADTVVSAIPASRIGGGLLWSEGSGHIYSCGHAASGSIQIVTGDARTPLATVGVGSYPVVLAASRQAQRVYVGHDGSPHVYVLCDTITGIEERKTETGMGAEGGGLGKSILRGPELARLDCRVIDALGRDVTDKRERLAPGVYFLQQTPGQRPAAARKVVIQR